MRHGLSHQWLIWVPPSHPLESELIILGEELMNRTGTLEVPLNTGDLQVVCIYCATVEITHGGSLPRNPCTLIGVVEDSIQPQDMSLTGILVAEKQPKGANSEAPLETLSCFALRGFSILT